MNDDTRDTRNTRNTRGAPDPSASCNPVTACNAAEACAACQSASGECAAAEPVPPRPLELVVISGKGGTGKTSVTASLACLAESLVLADADVDAADLHLVLEPEILEDEPFSGGCEAVIDPARCTGCGRCLELCRFDAIIADGGVCRVDPIACEGCGVCAWFCPAGAIAMDPAVNGRCFVSRTRRGTMVHARLEPGSENSGKLVTAVRRRAAALAVEQGRELVLIDGSPGIGCTVIASITAADLALIVTEPTVSGLHDLQRVAALTRHFGIPAVVCVNKWDINPETTEAIETFLLNVAAEGCALETLGRVRYDGAITKAQLAGRSVVEHADSGAAEDIRLLWQRLDERLKAIRAARSTRPTKGSA